MNGTEKIKIKIISKSGRMPSYETDGSAGADLRAYLKSPVTLMPGERRLIPTGLFIELPDGIEAQVRARSGLSIKHGISLVNGVGTVINVTEQQKTPAIFGSRHARHSEIELAGAGAAVNLLIFRVQIAASIDILHPPDGGNGRLSKNPCFH